MSEHIKLEPNLTIKGRWKYWMRKDDAIVHSSGMKTGSDIQSVYSSFSLAKH